MLLFHGTSLNRFKEAIRSGYLGTENTIWDCSEGETTYFYSEEFLKEEYDTTEGEDVKREGLRHAMESAEFALGLESKDLKRVVLVFESETLKKIGKLEKDDSCGENMEYCLKLCGKIPLDLIKEIWVDSENLDLLALYFIGLVETRSGNGGYYINLSDVHQLDSSLIEASKAVYKKLCEWFLENMEYPDVLGQTTIEELKRLA